MPGHNLLGIFFARTLLASFLFARTLFASNFFCLNLFASDIFCQDFFQILAKVWSLTQVARSRKKPPGKDSFFTKSQLRKIELVVRPDGGKLRVGLENLALFQTFIKRVRHEGVHGGNEGEQCPHR